MIEARRNRWFNAWFSWQVERRIGRTFAALRVRGVERVRALTGRVPLLVVANHSAWWDPMFPIYFFTRVCRGEGYAMMDAANLEKLPFLGRVGGFGVNLSAPADGAAAILYASRLLRGGPRIVWVFPQGRQVPLTEPQLRFLPGAAAIARGARIEHILPIGLRYEFGEGERPVFWASFGEPFAYNRDLARACAEQQEHVVAELERIDRAIRGLDDAAPFTSLIARRSSWLGALTERMLARLTRYG